MIIESEEMKSKHNKEAFACTDAFVADMLALHDEAFIKNPNAIFDKQDCQYYMATRLLVRALSGSTKYWWEYHCSSHAKDMGIGRYMVLVFSFLC
jgi:hypothetical protein